MAGVPQNESAMPGSPTPTPTQAELNRNSPLGGEAVADALTEAPTSIMDPPAPAADPFDPARLEMPEGFERGDKFDQFAAVMKEFGVSHAKAQELVKFHSEAVSAALKSTFDGWHKQQIDWQREIQADSELGGSNFDGVKQTIARVLDNAELTDPGFREAMGFTGAGNHPAVVRTVYRWAKALSEGTQVQGGVPGRNRNGQLAEERPSAASALYGPDGPHTGGPRLG